MWRGTWGKSCAKYDFVVYQEVESSLPDCLTIHFLQGVATTFLQKNDNEFGPCNTADILEKKVAHPNKPRNGVNYDNFCSFIIRYNSTHILCTCSTTCFMTLMHLYNTCFFCNLEDTSLAKGFKSVPAIHTRHSNAWQATSSISPWRIHSSMDTFQRRSLSEFTSNIYSK
jgi:hypothetical protein